MKFRDIFGLPSAEKGVENLHTREMDAFADNVIFELKTLISGAITRALEERESRYMRSILEESFFSLESLVIKAMDAQTSRELEDFLSNHEGINPQFRTHFFSQVVQREYRSTRGASVRVSPGLVPIFEVNAQSLDNATEDESFILSLKGRKVRFEARAVLNGPTRKTPSTTPEAVMAAPRGTAMNQALGSERKTAGARVHITLHDQHGSTEKWVNLPVLLGREAATAQGLAVGSGVDIFGTYVSRRQLIVFEALGQIYCFVPAEASLTCSTEKGDVLRPDNLRRLDANTPLRLLMGVPMDTLTAPAERGDRSDYPLVELSMGTGPATHADATPRPRAVR
jgi:hypothetical protein